MNTRITSASNIKGTKVKNLKKENIGEIQDMMIDLANGDVVYAVLSFGGFMGIGDKLFAVPVQALKYSKENNEITLDIDKDRLENAPGFDKNEWPMEASPGFLESVYEHYGYSMPYRDRVMR